VAADWALISAEAQYFGLRGVEQTMEMIELARDTLNARLSVLGLLLNRANMRTTHSRSALRSLRERYGTKVFHTVIRSSIAYAESARCSRSILDVRPDLGEDYLALAGEVLDRLPALAGPREPAVQLIVRGGVSDYGYETSAPPAVVGLTPAASR
jgi:chromosome partitioning protein